MTPREVLDTAAAIARANRISNLPELITAEFPSCDRFTRDERPAGTTYHAAHEPFRYYAGPQSVPVLPPPFVGDLPNRNAWAKAHDVVVVELTILRGESHARQSHFALDRDEFDALTDEEIIERYLQKSLRQAREAL